MIITQHPGIALQGSFYARLVGIQMSLCKNRRPKIHLFRRLRNLTATLTAYVFGVKHDTHLRETTRGLLHRLKMTWTLVHKRLNIGPPFYSPSVNSAFYFIARLRRQRSANGIQPNIAKRVDNLPQKIRGRPPKKK